MVLEEVFDPKNATCPATKKHDVLCECDAVSRGVKILEHLHFRTINLLANRTIKLKVHHSGNNLTLPLMR